MKTLLITCLALLITIDVALAQVVNGRVSAPDGEPLIGVNVLEKGTTNGTSTDLDGRYTLRLISSDATLVFSFVGFQKEEIDVAGRTEIDVILEEGIKFSEVVVVGTRSYNRSVTETPVAVDVFDVDEITENVGQLDVNQILQYAAPSFNANRQSGADGSDHIDPATLRGLGPDQTLVLINGKRRHQSSLINIFGARGRGNTGTDLNAIPASAIERIEILRDGASAQYGSDAIAGVINIVLKSSVDEFSGGVSGGIQQARFRTDKDLDGEHLQLNGNYGVPLGERGFLNLTADYLAKGRTNRPADPNEFDIYRRQFGDAELENFGAYFNSAVPVSETASFYAFGGYNFRDTDAFAWTRDPDSDRNVPAIYPGGFDPHITSNITDQSVSAGIRARLRAWDVDLNNTFGSNRFHYIIEGTLNASLLERSPTRFDAGGFQLAQNTTGLTFSRFYDQWLAGVNVAFGAEYRIENYEIFAGEEGSWRNYGVIDTLVDGRIQQVDVLGRPGGSQGFPGFRPENELDEFRTNVSAFIDGEFDLSEMLMVAAALRFERYSDFGETVTGKLVTRVELTDQIALRASASTGFRAPSLAQIYFNSTFTDFVAGTPVDKIIARNNSPITRTLGIPALKEETARNASLGFTANLFNGFTLTVDGYFVDIDDRIVLTGAFEDTDPDIGAELRALNVGAAQFFTNAIDTETIGVDVIAAYTTLVGLNRLRVSLAANFNDMELGSVNTSPKLAGKEDVYFGPREQFFLLASAPETKFNLTLDWTRDRYTANVRFVRFGEVVLMDWLDTEDIYESKITTDVGVGYAITPNVRLAVGGANIFDVYPTQQDTETETGGLWDAVQMGFSGAYYYGKLLFKIGE